MFEDTVKSRKDIETSRKPLTSKRWDRSDLIMFDWWRSRFDKSPRIFLIFLQCNIHIFGAKGWKTSTAKLKTIILRWQDQWCLERLRTQDVWQVGGIHIPRMTLSMVKMTTQWRILLYTIHEHLFEHFPSGQYHHIMSCLFFWSTMPFCYQKSPANITHSIHVWYIYISTFPIKNQPNIGKYTIHDARYES